MSDFWVLFTKELKNLLRDKKLIFGLVIVPLLIYPALGKGMGIGIEKAQGETHVAIANFDSGGYGSLLIRTLNSSPNVTITLVEAENVGAALERASSLKQNVLVVVPPGFSESIAANRSATVYIYGIFSSMGTGMKESVSEGRINAIIQALSRGIAEIKVKKLGFTEPSALLNPIQARSLSYIRGRLVNVSPSMVSAILASQSVTLPIVVFLMVTLTAQIAAGVIASEKENKTLETLLTLPVKRTTIVASKIGGTAVMGIIAALTYTFGMRSYIGSSFGASKVSLGDLGIRVTPQGILLFGVAVFLTVAFALSLAMLLAIFSEDVQSANTVVSSVILPLAFPSFILMYTDLSSLPKAAAYALLSDPFTHPIVAYQWMLAGEYARIAWSIGYLSAAALVLLYLTARAFSGEKVLTAKIGWGRKRR